MGASREGSVFKKSIFRQAPRDASATQNVSSAEDENFTNITSYLAGPSPCIIQTHSINEALPGAMLSHSLLTLETNRKMLH
jgi:hypothetical protein